jgi:hypothetical protein
LRFAISSWSCSVRIEAIAFVCNLVTDSCGFGFHGSGLVGDPRSSSSSLRRLFPDIAKGSDSTGDGKIAIETAATPYLEKFVISSDE